MPKIMEQSPIRVLIAEDYALIRLGLKGQFSLEPGFEVVGEAKNGEQAIELTSKLSPDDGIEATQEIKSGVISPRVIALSAFGNDSQVVGMLAAGADGYCLKSIEWPQLLAVIRLIKDGGTYLDPKIAHKVAIMLKSTVTSPPKPAVSNKSPVPVLSDREREILQLISEGLSNPKIATRLYLSLGTVKSYVRNILNKLSVDDRVQASAKAVREGLI